MSTVDVLALLWSLGVSLAGWGAWRHLRRWRPRQAYWRRLRRQAAPASEQAWAEDRAMAEGYLAAIKLVLVVQGVGRVLLLAQRPPLELTTADYITTTAYLAVVLLLRHWTRQSDRVRRDWLAQAPPNAPEPGMQ